ncbi:hypothetical protein DDZ13_05760 [Coraliomargarita sinensis]|uniref:PEP-CTERM protein-sorting domain-containing protein n=1 Tax=Coraliomargarita sinensis TaxID=2174842 RepID=A0A317ZGI4_9BACT|nr:PEP-CTERM sorting domain-containing protein [Coraliomargarita sinensis]PXA04676.1 hypothetical protein DDZ13_05760 [Coraliomargarita sinensis]
MMINTKRRISIFVLAATLATGVNAVTLVWDGGTGNFTDSNWDDGTSLQTHPSYGSGSFDTVINTGTVNGFTNSNTADFTSDDTLTISGGAVVEGDFLRVNNTSNTENVITFESGTINLSSFNAFRSGFGGFLGHLNFTGAADSATVTQFDLTGTTNQKMANKIGADGGVGSFFAIDGTMVASGVSYDGTNLTEVNSGLASNAVNGRYFEITESGGAQTLHLRAIPEPSALSFFALALGGTLLIRRRR